MQWLEAEPLRFIADQRIQPFVLHLLCRSATAADEEDALVVMIGMGADDEGVDVGEQAHEG